MRRLALLIFVLALLAACEPPGKTPPATIASWFDTDVVVIGAGLSGLHAAMLLEEQGLRGQVLEARKRVGGRVHTLNDIPGNPETGANIIAGSYARILNVAKQLKLDITPAAGLAGGRNNQLLHINGEFITHTDWANSGQNPFPDPLRQHPPERVLVTSLQPNPLSTAREWTLSENQPHDIPLSDHFVRMGFNQRAQQLALHTDSYGSDAAGTTLLKRYHVMASFLDAIKTRKPLMSIAGGNQRLPEAMAASLMTPVMLGKTVIAIEQDTDAITVHCRDGSSFRAAVAIAAIPFTALRDIKLTPDLPPLQRQAVEELRYNPAVLAHLIVKAPYWGERTPSIWTDRAIERILATSLDGTGEVTNATVWINGANAATVSAMNAKHQQEFILTELEAIFPGIGKKVELASIVDWAGDPFSKGTWADWAPGQISRFANDLATPFQRLHFAGEHTAKAHTGMEGAMESGERAAMEIIMRPGTSNHD